MGIKSQWVCCSYASLVLVTKVPDSYWDESNEDLFNSAFTGAFYELIPIPVIPVNLIIIPSDLYFLKSVSKAQS